MVSLLDFDGGDFCISRVHRGKGNICYQLIAIAAGQNVYNLTSRAYIAILAADW